MPISKIINTGHSYILASLLNTCPPPPPSYLVIHTCMHIIVCTMYTHTTTYQFVCPTDLSLTVCNSPSMASRVCSRATFSFASLE